MRGSWYYRTQKGHYSSLTAAWMTGEIEKITRGQHPVIYFDDPMEAVTDLGRWDNCFRVGTCRTDSHFETESFLRDWSLSFKVEAEVDEVCDYVDVLGFLKRAWPMIDSATSACTLWVKEGNTYLFPLDDDQSYIFVEVLPKEDIKA